MQSRGAPSGTTVIVFAPTPPGREWELTPVVISGGTTAESTIASPSTRRAALGVLSDLAPTTLQLLRAPADADMTGTELRVAKGEIDIAAFERFGADGAVRARFFLPASVGYTVGGLIFYLALIAVLVWGSVARWRSAFRLGICTAAAFPLAILITGAMQHWWRAGGESPVVLMAVCALVGLVAARLRGLGPVFAIAGLVVAVIAIDVATTGPIHTASILGYSLPTTGRFYGLPNASTSVFVASLFLLAGATVGRAWTVVRAATGVAILGVGLAFVAAPWLGGDVGGTLALVPVVAATAWLFLGRRLTRRAVVVGSALSAAATVAFVAAQASLGSGTHLGRAATEGARDNAAVTNTIAHRFDANFGLLMSQWWGFGCLLLAAFGVYALARRGWFSDRLPPGSPMRVVAIAVLVFSVLGFVVNDSGPVVIVLCHVVLAPALALVALTPVKPAVAAPL